MQSLKNGGNEATKSIISFLKTNVPKSDIPNIENELRKDFLLAKKKSKAKEEKQKKKSHALTRKEKKSLSFYTISKKSFTYCEMLPLNNIWIEYITQVLELDKFSLNPDSKTWDQLSQSLYRADFHGSILQVIRSKCPSYVGKKGICIMDTKNTFKLLSEVNIITTVPKKECVFEMYIGNQKIFLYGKHLCVRPAERSVKKVKSQLHPDL